MTLQIETATHSAQNRTDHPLAVPDDLQIHHDESTKRTGSIPRPIGVNAKSRILWENLIPFLVFHSLLPFAFSPSIFSWWGVAFLPIGNYLFCSLGIGAGYHRLLTHRGFQCPKWFEYTLATLGMCSLQDSPVRWALVHRIHHQHSDHQPDPHTPMAGIFWSHVGWMFVENRELDSAVMYDRYARDLLKDRYYFWMQRGGRWVIVYLAHALAITAMGFLFGWLQSEDFSIATNIALQWFMWGVIYRTVFTWHVTAAINSAAHVWGYRNYETRENSRNNWLCGLLTNGEGWHNNHHADPRSAKHGHRWWELDLTYATLCLCERIGLVWNVARPNSTLLERKSLV